MDFTSRKALAATLDLAPVSIIVADREGRIVAWNRASEALFGFLAEDVLGQSLDVIIPEHLRDPHCRQCHRGDRGGAGRDRALPCGARAARPGRLALKGWFIGTGDQSFAGSSPTAL